MYSSFSTGCFVGCVFGGFFNERFFANVDKIICCVLLLTSASCIAIARSTTLSQIGASLALNGFAEGVIGTGALTSRVEICIVDKTGDLNIQAPDELCTEF